MWPAIGAIGGALIGALGQKSANEENIDNQRDFAQHGISWKVQDAKEAGLHPLYALGGSGATYTPSSQNIFPSDVMMNAGQNLGRAAGAADPNIRAMQMAQLKVAESEAEKNFALASAARSEADRNRQQWEATAPIFPLEQIATRDERGDWVMNPEGTMSHPVKPPYEANIISKAMTPEELEAANIESQYPYLEGKKERGFKRYTVPGFGEVILPNAQNLAEAMESLEDKILQGIVLGANTAHYGPQHWERFKRFVGRGPFGPKLPWMD